MRPLSRRKSVPRTIPWSSNSPSDRSAPPRSLEVEAWSECSWMRPGRLISWYQSVSAARCRSAGSPTNSGTITRLSVAVPSGFRVQS
jgi:hypothetical protein